MSGVCCAACVSWIGGSQHVLGATPHLAPNVVRVLRVLPILERLALFAGDTQDIFHGSRREWRLCSQRNIDVTNAFSLLILTLQNTLMLKLTLKSLPFPPFCLLGGSHPSFVSTLFYSSSSLAIRK